MNVTRIATVSALVLGLAGVSLAPAIAQPTQSDVGSFLRDQKGEVIGSLHAIHGDQAVVWYGFVNTPGNHLATVPLSAIDAHGNRLVLNDTGLEMAQR